MSYSYKPSGVCSRNFTFDIENDIIKDIKITGGCDGNLKGIINLLKGMDVDSVINKLEGIKCGLKGTSCPDQISKALKSFKA